MAITTAVVPVAGLATRLRPLSRGVPKALLPVAGKPVVGHIVDELAACGIERVVLVTGSGGAAFAAHFSGGLPGPDVVCADQPRPLGLGDAILRAAPEVDGAVRDRAGRCADRPRAADARGRAPGRRGRDGARAAVAVEEVAPAATDRYGIVLPDGEGDPFAVAGVVEKPAPAAAPSLLAVAGRYAATAALLDALRATKPDAGGEVQLADALAAMDGVVATRLRPGEERFDVGTVPGYCAAFVDYALSDPELGPALRAGARALLDGER